MRTRIFRLAAAACCLAPAGCSHVDLLSRIDLGAAATSRQVDRHRDAFAGALGDAARRAAEQDVDRPWLAGAPEPLAREVTLPEALRAPMETALMFPGGRVDLPTLAERITLATGIQVRVRPEALMPLEQFAPRLAQTAPAAPAALTELPAGSHPLPRMLDLVANRLGVYWKYEDGAIQIFRTDTRVFNVRALALKSSAAASLGRTGNASGGAFESTSATRIEAAGGDPVAAVKAKLEPFMTRAGVVAINTDASGLAVVTDTPDALDRIGAFLERENRALTRRVRLLFEEIELVSKNNNEQGIDWNLVYARSRAAARLAAPATLASDAATAVALSPGSGPFEGSSLIVNALSEIGTVVRRTSVPLQTLNRRPVTHAVRTTFTYIDQVQVTTVASSAGTSTAPSVTQKEETVGTFLTVIPDAQEDGQILLSIAYDNTVAQPLKTLVFGTGGNQVQLQQKTVDGMGTVQQVELRPGQPVVISGFERAQDQYDKRRIDENLPLLFGGSGKASSSRSTTLVIVTAQLEEGL
ncbi:lipoprotein [Pigmentiphaga soli]|uniref:Lipoprotein n=1 Tax=Pigmentiphaga soli TaxID=1007095 RepID=A0ABP8GEL2_9BURK